MATEIVQLGDVCTALQAQCGPLASFDIHPASIQWTTDEHGLKAGGFQGSIEHPDLIPERLTEHALAQTASLCNIPSGYLLRCPADLQVQNLRHWTQFASGGKRRFRARVGKDTGNIEAMFTNAYSEYDPATMLGDLKDTLGDLDVQLTRADVDNFGLNMQCMLPGTEWEIDPNKHHFPSFEDSSFGVGLSFGDSGIGIRGISVKLNVVRLICTNGLIVPVGAGIGVALRHIGDHASLKAAMPSYIGKLTDMKEPFMERLLESTKKSAIPTNWNERTWLQNEAAIKLFKGWWLRNPSWANENCAKVIANLMVEKYNTTKWGVVNAITEFSKHAATGEAATAMDEYAGRLMFDLDIEVPGRVVLEDA